jgi:short-subunit dehydrogenase
MKPVVVNVNSFGGRIPLRNMSAYTASKFALAGFTDAIRPEFADLGIHVAHVHPGAL